MAYRIRTAVPDDAPRILAVYAPYVTGSVISFEVEVPTVKEFRRRIERTTERCAYLVVVDEATDEVAGYAYNGAFRSRPAYDWVSETSIYLAPAHQGRHLGSVLLEALEDLMRAQGVRMSEACITSDNEASIAFHRAHGYRVCGEHTNCGYKLGRWLSVTWMEKQLLPFDAHPEPRHAPDRDAVDRVIEKANEQLAALCAD